MRLTTANVAGSIQAAETIIHGRRRGNCTRSHYLWSSSGRNTVYVNRRTARVLIVEVRQNST